MSNTPLWSLLLSQRGTEDESAVKMITIKCQRLTVDKTYEEAEIEVPAPVFKKLEGREEERKGTWDWGLAETLAQGSSQ